METYSLKGYYHVYPGCDSPALQDVNFSVNTGDFLLVLGKTGSGKSTLLRSLKPQIAPAGECSGTLEYMGEILSSVDSDRTVAEIGFVFQNPDTQLVCDEVLQELCFTASNLGLEEKVIKRRLAELCASFGISHLLNRKTSELSGGEKQLVSLMGVLLTRPQVIVLDEPLAGLDPVCAEEFLATLERLNRDFGTTIILSEHHSESVFALANKVLVLDCGKVAYFGTTEDCVRSEECEALLPVTARFCKKLGQSVPAYTVRECAGVYEKCRGNIITSNSKPEVQAGETLLSAKGLTYRYSKTEQSVLRGVNLNLQAGTVVGVVGGNGSGKSTLLSLLAGTKKPNSGKVKTGAKVVLLPQNPLATFLEDSVGADLDLFRKVNGISEEELSNTIASYPLFSGIEKLYGQNPLDLSGGEVQKVALLKVALSRADVVLLDEAERGLDQGAKEDLVAFATHLREQGKCVVVVSHNLEFVYSCCDSVALLFAGEVVAQDKTHPFFCDNQVYTTTLGKITGGKAFCLSEVEVQYE